MAFRNIEIATNLRSFSSTGRVSIPDDFPFAASPELKAWLALSTLPATLPWYGEGLFLAAAASVAQAQVGYGVLANGKKSKDWPDNWVVIGDVSADPIVANPALAGTPVFYSVHGGGEWEGERLAPTLSSFAESLAIWLEAVGDSDTPLEDGALRPEVAQAVSTQIAALVGDQCLPLWLGRHWLD